MEPNFLKQPSKDWSWTLDIGGCPSRYSVTWEDLARGLKGLSDDQDSFLILIQRQGEEYWFLQCALELVGGHEGEYLVECGWSSEDGPVLLSRHCGFGEAEACFWSVFEKGTLHFEGFEDRSGSIPENQCKKLLDITRLEVGALGTNCYLAAEKEQKLCAVIDPGGDGQRIISQVKTRGLEVRYILLTHGHFDHVDALPEVAAAFPEAEVWVHRKDVIEGGGQLFPLAAMLADPECPVKEFHYLKAFNDRDVPSPEAKQLPLGGLVIHPMHTPGHSEGSVSFRVSGGPIFCGDVLFQGSCGRTDFPGGNEGKMMASLRFFGLMNGDADVYPGHMGPTTLEKERARNPYLRQALRERP